MEFRTIVDIEDPGYRIDPCEELLFVGSCFATEIGRRFEEEKFRVTVNPFGVMYNPASILHTIQRLTAPYPKVAFLTLGTNHVYRLKETGEIEATVRSVLLRSLRRRNSLSMPVLTTCGRLSICFAPIIPMCMSCLP